MGDAEELEKAGKPNHQTEAILLHFESLPFHYGCHAALHPRFIVDDATDLARAPVASR